LSRIDGAGDAPTDSLDSEVSKTKLNAALSRGSVELARVDQNKKIHRFVVVGGGAGGLELVTGLGNLFGRRRRAEVVLIDSDLTHLWKPLLHEVAAGTKDSHDDELDYLSQARWNHFQFRLGRVEGLDRRAQTVKLAPTSDDTGQLIIPAREVPYDSLVFSVGSVSNEFGIPGVREHCLFLDSRAQADQFQRRLLHECMRAQSRGEQSGPEVLTMAIIGAGATGVELAAELHHVTRQLVAYGFDRIDPERDVKLVLIEGAPQILPALPKRLADASARELRRLGVEIHTGKRVTKVTKEGVHTHDGLMFPAQIKLWTAGIKAPDFLRNLDGLESNGRNQLMVHQTLQTTRDENIFALGDCSNCPRPGSDQAVPPTAQAAHQQASLLLKSFQRRLAGKPLPVFVYRDYGSLVSLSAYSTVGNLMGNLTGNVMIEGWIARLVYRMLYRMHQRALHGTLRAILLMVADWLTRATHPRLKLH
jgi:NADH dehydrogenase